MLGSVHFTYNISLVWPLKWQSQLKSSLHWTFVLRLLCWSTKDHHITGMSSLLPYTSSCDMDSKVRQHMPTYITAFLTDLLSCSCSTFVGLTYSRQKFDWMHWVLKMAMWVSPWLVLVLDPFPFYYSVFSFCSNNNRGWWNKSHLWHWENMIKKDCTLQYCIFTITNHLVFSLIIGYNNRCLQRCMFKQTPNPKY